MNAIVHPRRGIKDLAITNGLMDTHSIPTTIGLVADEQIDSACDVFKDASHSEALKVLRTAIP
ncbi:hypothetical protein [Mycolicibacterium parafortuitum]|uniref:Uncharacterized protein n=1 Tax=Mycolicibacterium parafortuitum TaxID=39692 RepID=A0A375YNE5_MYCPF|nr:hypothetical protein [Mycolicibacterium parafortuitum]ORB28625.1 hypothetical protein BST38_19475 [Mycolicibacterium parafortuitum]SRX82504.1 hypothetical protein MPP7335_04264 [Mycolicibacterium parafortuitum]